jgi:hypothetical protein
MQHFSQTLSHTFNFVSEVGGDNLVSKQSMVLSLMNCVVRQVVTNISEEYSASIYPENGGSIFLQNVKQFSDYTLSQISYQTTQCHNPEHISNPVMRCSNLINGSQYSY